MNEIPNLSSAHSFTEGSETTAQASTENPQAGRYWSDAEVDADRMKLILFCFDDVHSTEELDALDVLKMYKAQIEANAH